MTIVKSATEADEARRGMQKKPDLIEAARVSPVELSIEGSGTSQQRGSGNNALCVKMEQALGIAPLVGVKAVPVERDSRAPVCVQDVEGGMLVCLASIGAAKEPLHAGTAHTYAHPTEQCAPMRLRPSGSCALGGGGARASGDQNDDEQD